MALRRKDTRIESAEAIAARRFGISEDAFGEIERSIGEYLALHASAIARAPCWTQRETREKFTPGDENFQVYGYDWLAREFAKRLGGVFADAAVEYVRLLTKTITEHRLSKQPIPWESISSQAREVCNPFIPWERSKSHLYKLFLNLGIDFRRIGPRVSNAFMSGLSIWPSTFERKAQRTIRHIALLAPGKISTPASRRQSRRSPTQIRDAIIGSIKRKIPRLPRNTLIRRICVELDKKDLGSLLVEDWKARGFTSWTGAWLDPGLRPSVKKLISETPTEKPPIQQ